MWEFLKLSGLLAVLSFVLVEPTRAQITPTPVIGGVLVHCTDPSGAVVYTDFLPTLSDSAQSTINAAGQRLILINLPVLAHLPPLIQLFIYAHECGHHISGDVIAGIILHEDNLNREKTADRIGIRLLRDQFHVTPQQAAFIASTFQNNPAMFPYYLPGPLRAKWIRDCYATNNDACTAHHQTAPAQDNTDHLEDDQADDSDHQALAPDQKASAAQDESTSEDPFTDAAGHTFDSGFKSLINSSADGFTFDRTRFQGLPASITKIHFSYDRQCFIGKRLRPFELSFHREKKIFDSFTVSF